MGAPGVSLRLVEEDVYGNIRNQVWLLRPQPSTASDTVITTQFDLGYPETTVATYPLTEGNGVEDLTRFHGSSTVTVDAVLIGPDRFYINDLLRSMCYPSKRTYLYVNRPEWDSERRLRLRANPVSFISDSQSEIIWKVGMSWSNPSGIMEAVDITTFLIENSSSDLGETGTTPTTPGSSTVGSGYGSLLYGGGLYGSRPVMAGMSGLFGVGEEVMDLSTVRSYGYGRGDYGTLSYGSDEALSGENQILVKGNIPVLPTIKITGPCTSPQLAFNSIGTTMYLKGLVLGPGDYLLIDVPSKQILLNGEFTASRYRFLSLAAGDGWNGWPYLQDGLNDVNYVTGSHGAGSTVEFTYRDAWV